MIVIIFARDDLTKLTYTTMCIKGTMRLYPIGPIISRLSEEFVGNGVRIPKGKLKFFFSLVVTCIARNMDWYWYLHLTP